MIVDMSVQSSTSSREIRSSRIFAKYRMQFVHVVICSERGRSEGAPGWFEACLAAALPGKPVIPLRRSPGMP